MSNDEQPIAKRHEWRPRNPLDPEQFCHVTQRAFEIEISASSQQLAEELLRAIGERDAAIADAIVNERWRIAAQLDARANSISDYTYPDRAIKLALHESANRLRSQSRPSDLGYLI